MTKETKLTVDTDQGRITLDMEALLTLLQKATGLKKVELVSVADGR